MLIARSTARKTSFGPTSKAASGCWRRLAISGDHWKDLRAADFASCTCRQMRSTARSDRKTRRFPKLMPTPPNSPYSASKAASDHLVRAYHHTYGLPVLTTNCSNNYGPYQFPEKLIPLVIANALAGKPLPIYGDGMNVRDWLHVSDHCAAIRVVLAQGRAGETYNIGGWNEMPNLVIVKTICALLDELQPSVCGPYERLIGFVKDRPGHDRRYAIDARKIERELGWRPAETFDSGIRKTVQWYLDHGQWTANVQSGAYRNWIAANYVNRA